jgi:hypothetical protein
MNEVTWMKLPPYGELFGNKLQRHFNYGFLTGQAQAFEWMKAQYSTGQPGDGVPIAQIDRMLEQVKKALMEM